MLRPLIVLPEPELLPWIHHILVMGFRDACVSTIPAVLSPSVMVFARGGGSRIDADGTQHRLPRAMLSGPCLAPRVTTVAAGTVFVSILFRPGLMADALGPGVGELRDGSFPLDALVSPADLVRTLAQIDDDPNPCNWARALQALLLGHFRLDSSPQRAAASGVAMQHLFRPAREIAQDLGIGLRQLERRIDRAFGANLRELRRLARFGYSLARLTAAPTPHGGLARVAQDFGYFDQSHMDRDFQALTGYSPRAICQAAGGDDPGLWLYRFGQSDFRRLFLGEDVDSVQETLFRST